MFSQYASCLVSEPWLSVTVRMEEAAEPTISLDQHLPPLPKPATRHGCYRNMSPLFFRNGRALPLTSCTSDVWQQVMFSLLFSMSK